VIGLGSTAVTQPGEAGFAVAVAVAPAPELGVAGFVGGPSSMDFVTAVALQAITPNTTAAAHHPTLLSFIAILICESVFT
jgi:hypothetical protein